MKRLSTLLVVIAAIASAALAQVGGRFAPKGTFQGDPATLISIARGNPGLYNPYYEGKLGPGWDEPGTCVRVGERITIPDGTIVPGNALLTREGTIAERATRQRGDDYAYCVKNTKTGLSHYFKSCGQGFEREMPRGPAPPPVYETDITQKITISASATATATAESESHSIATGIGGNASAMLYAPPPKQYPARRVLATVGSETNTIATIAWLPQTKINNKNLQWQDQWQEQQQQQQQMQQQMQQMQQQMQLLLEQMGLGGGK